MPADSRINASIDALLVQMVASVNAPPEGWELLFDVKRQHADAQQLAMITRPTILFDPENWQEVRRSSNRQIEHYVVRVVLAVKVTKATDPLIDSMDRLAEQLRDWFAARPVMGGRILDVEQPAIVDRESIRTPCVYVTNFALSVELLAGWPMLAPVLPDPASLFTQARRAVWDAIENWTWPEEFEWKRLFKSDTDTEELLLREAPSLAELPAISLEWSQPFSVEQILNVLQKCPASLRISLWLPAGSLTLAEYLGDQLMQAVCRCTPEGSTVPYVRKVTGHLPEPLGPFQISGVNLPGEPAGRKALKVTLTIVLPIYLDYFHGGNS